MRQAGARRAHSGWVWAWLLGVWLMGCGVPMGTWARARPASTAHCLAPDADVRLSGQLQYKGPVSARQPVLRLDHPVCVDDGDAQRASQVVWLDDPQARLRGELVGRCLAHCRLTGTLQWGAPTPRTSLRRARAGGVATAGQGHLMLALADDPQAPLAAAGAQAEPTHSVRFKPATSAPGVRTPPRLRAP